jgi:hypothetical protein
MEPGTCRSNSQLSETIKQAADKDGDLRVRGLEIDEAILE